MQRPGIRRPHGYDEERGLSRIIFEKGTKIEIPIEDEYGAKTWIAGEITSTQAGSLDFQVGFRGSRIDSGTWTKTRNRAEMEVTWRLPPALRKRQPSVHIILTAQGYSPWHHPHHGSHWLRLQPCGAWAYKERNVYGIKQDRVFGWRRGLSMMNMDEEHSGGGDFDMRSACEDHMSKEDLGPEASKQDWTDLQTLREDIRYWEELISHQLCPIQELNRWSQVPRRSKEISCFHASTKVRMYTTTKGGPQYNRMDKLVRGDKLWTRRYRRNRREPSQGHVSIVECVMTFACPPDGQPMVEIEGNFLTPDHYIARGNGEWSTAGALAHPAAESSQTLAHIVYNIKLQNGGQIELGNRVYAATRGARFDTVDPGLEPMYCDEASRHLHDLAGYASGYIHWALGTASVDCYGIPSPKRRIDPPSIISTATLLDKEIMEVIFVSQHADQKWIDTLSMMRRVHGTWNHAALSIYPEFTVDTLRTPTQEEKKTWRATFYREKERPKKGFAAGGSEWTLSSPTQRETSLKSSGPTLPPLISWQRP